jgi:hypothetical protein
MGFKFQLVSSDGEVIGGFEAATDNWRSGDLLIASGNVRYRVVSLIPDARIAEFVDVPDAVGLIEVEPL